MSEYSHGMDFMQASTGFPFCRGDTRIEDPEPLAREGRGWGVGWTIFGEPDAVEACRCGGGGFSTRWGVGCWILGGRKAGGPGGRCCCGGGGSGGGGSGCLLVLLLFKEVMASVEEARASKNSASAPKSSSIFVVVVVGGVLSVWRWTMASFVQ